MFHCSCPPSEKTDACSGCKASIREIPPESIQLVLSLFCRGISKHTGASDCVKTVHNGDQADCLQSGARTLYLSTSAVIICLLQLHGSLSSSRKEQLHPLSKPQQNTLRSVITCISMNKAFVTGVLAQSQGYTQSIISPPHDACAQSFPSAPSALQDPVSQCLAQMLQLVQAQNEPRFKSPIIQSCQTLVSCTLSGKQPLGTIFNCHCQFFLHILATNILVDHTIAQNIFFCSREANYVAPSCFCHD